MIADNIQLNELIPIEILLKNDSSGFKIIPIDINSKTPAIKSTNEIYENPNYWTAQKLKQEHHRFRNVATTFGKTHLKDVNGEDLYLHGLDIDSDNVLGIQFDLLEELKLKTYVTKTKKDCGYHVYWLSHKQHPPIGTTKCRSGYEFEIKSDNSLGLCTLPPSTHRDDPKFRYQSIGQEKIAIDDTLYDRILDLLANECLIQSHLNEKPSDYNGNGKATKSDSGSVYRILQDDELEQIISYVRTSYRKGFRHDLVFGLSGLLFKNKISLPSARQLISTLCDFTHDEEKASRLQVLDNTYLKGLDGQEIKGISQLQEALARVHGGNGDSEEDYSGQILESINEVLNRGHEQKKRNNSSNNNSTSTQTLIQLAKQNTTLFFKDQYGIAYAKIKVATHGEIIAVESTKFEYYLSKLYYDSSGGEIAGQESLNNAIRVLLAETFFEGLTIDLNLRVAWGKKKGEELYYDLADTEWRCIKVTGQNWEIIQNSGVLFTRFNQKPQIEPDRNYPINIFDKYLDLMHINNPEHRLLIKVWTIATIIPDIPHPINVPYGEKGSVKTTFCKFQKRLIDPDKIELLTVPQEKSEFVQQQYHNYLTVYDNIKKIPYWFSDEVCKAITGVGSSKRKLYTNDEDVIYSYKRCLIINGINNSLTEPDALDRSILTEFERIPDEKRKEESKVEAEFEEMKPKLLGCIFDILVKSLQIKPTVQLHNLPRMADFTVWGEAIARAMGYEPMQFVNTYYDNIGKQNVEAIESNPIAQAIEKFVYSWHKEGQEACWQSPTSKVLQEINKTAQRHNIDTSNKSWPKAANSLTKRLRPILSNLREGLGIRIVIIRNTTGKNKNTSTIRYGKNLHYLHHLH